LQRLGFAILGLSESLRRGHYLRLGLGLHVGRHLYLVKPRERSPHVHSVVDPQLADFVTSRVLIDERELVILHLAFVPRCHHRGRTWQLVRQRPPPSCTERIFSSLPRAPLVGKKNSAADFVPSVFRSGRVLLSSPEQLPHVIPVP
jgi:hypothetical protein